MFAHVGGWRPERAGGGLRGSTEVAATVGRNKGGGVAISGPAGKARDDAGRGSSAKLEQVRGGW